MSELTFTLLTDGSSDRALIPILRWCLLDNGVRIAIQERFADFRLLRNPPQGLVQKIQKSLDLFPCDLLFIHRDAERESRKRREQEIREALAELGDLQVPSVCVVPVRMQEAWLLFDEAAIRRAAGNPNGDDLIVLPRPREIEDLPDPKGTLQSLARNVCGLGARRRQGFKVPPGRVADLIDDFAPLRGLSAFRAMEESLQAVLRQKRWIE